MGTIAKTKEYWLKKTTENGPTIQTRTANCEVEVTSSKVSGSWITFPDGSKFRRPTNYSKRTYKIQGDEGQHDTSYHNTQTPTKPRPRNTDSVGGGYRADDLLGANCPNVRGLTFGKLYDQVSMPTLMVNEAVTKALNNIADQKANVGETLATFRQTLALVASPSKYLLNGIKTAYNNKAWKPFLGKALRDIQKEGPVNLAAQEYLKYVYGWKPIMQDIYGIMELAKGQGARPLLLHGRGVSNQQNQSRVGTYVNASHSCETELGPLNERVKVSCDIHGRIDPDAQGLRTLNQLGLLNPASLAWELVRFSFIVDWFVPIGPVLNALSAPAGLTFVSATKSVKVSVSGPFKHFNDSYRYGSGNINVTKSDATGTATMEAYRRETYGSWPIPGFYFAEDPFRGDRPLKALALAIVSLRKYRV